MVGRGSQKTCALGYVTWACTLARVPAARAASFLYLVPAVTLGIAWIWFGEWPTRLALLGGAIAISGVVIVNVFGKSLQDKGWAQKTHQAERNDYSKDK